jgi:hypothetical protein
VVTKQAFDKGELIQEITRTKKQLGFVEKKLLGKGRIQTTNNKENETTNHSKGDHSND